MRISGLEGKYGVKAKIQMPVTHNPISLSSEGSDVIEESAREVGTRAKRMNSGAGHDSENMAGRVKTGMIFVPSVGKTSHSPLD